MEQNAITKTSQYCSMQFLRQHSIASPPKTFGLQSPLEYGLNMAVTCFQQLTPKFQFHTKSLFSVSLSLYCLFTQLLEWKPVIMLCQTSGRHSCSKEPRTALVHGQQETEIIRPPTSRKANPANNPQCTWQETCCQVNLQWRPLSCQQLLATSRTTLRKRLPAWPHQISEPQKLWQPVCLLFDVTDSSITFHNNRQHMTLYLGLYSYVC